MEWKLNTGKASFEAYVSSGQLPGYLPCEPVVFQWTEAGLPRSVDDLFTRVKGQKNLQRMGRSEAVEPVVMAAKKLIDIRLYAFAVQQKNRYFPAITTKSPTKFSLLTCEIA